MVDGRWNFVGPVVPHVDRRVKADAFCLSVAAASILAKVTRDRFMREQAEHYPHWSFDTNKGYPCPVHKAALQGYGPSAIHRRTWVFMDHYVPVARPAGRSAPSSRRCSEPAMDAHPYDGLADLEAMQRGVRASAGSPRRCSAYWHPGEMDWWYFYGRDRAPGHDDLDRRRRPGGLGAGRR